MQLIALLKWLYKSYQSIKTDIKFSSTSQHIKKIPMIYINLQLFLYKE